jgi:hypothetical protein
LSSGHTISRFTDLSPLLHLRLSLDYEEARVRVVVEATVIPKSHHCYEQGQRVACPLRLQSDGRGMLQGTILFVRPRLKEDSFRKEMMARHAGVERHSAPSRLALTPLWASCRMRRNSVDQDGADFSLLLLRTARIDIQYIHTRR